MVPKKKSTLEKALGSYRGGEFQYAFSQMKSSQDICEKTHEFGLVEAIDIKDFSPCMVPGISISMYGHNFVGDNNFMPLRDTCANSFHWYAEDAIHGSIREALERQFLIKFWLTATCNRKLCHKEALGEIKNKNAKQFFELMLRKGYVEVLDITDTSFPGACVIVVFGAPEATIQYCTGMSYDENVGRAIEKSVLELWQSYRFLSVYESIFNDISVINDPYQIHFVNSNEFGTFEKMIDVVELNTASKDIEMLNSEELIDLLSGKGISTYIYVKRTVVGDKHGYFSKLISPNMFMHMNTSRNINFKNVYSSAFENKIIQERINEMVPFP
ncbi:hypothetical protein L861_23245 [Litchfieldella anticariensis FP35 = DSM 16096]|uniref:YcaO domain-containing protein n=1 Tax=Litchfieldella anticariensis (strain DSM 16096 / CECT 5854 / CIP 108499 / LMG 22089 / FP35) TaxID=1121939 RepID=S2KRU8_LITA3|nr:hypothetical protein L861_23245 [Halomonas anticariensis FP35 = DSM 16096]